jgi:hypothetical protein
MKGGRERGRRTTKRRKITGLKKKSESNSLCGVLNHCEDIKVVWPISDGHLILTYDMCG